MVNFDVKNLLYRALFKANNYFYNIKWTALILILNILSATLPIELISFSSCCDEKKEICEADTQQENEKDDCCEDSSCHCPCCHLTNFFSNQDVSKTQIQGPFVELSFNYEFKYSMDSFSSLFRPPLA